MLKERVAALVAQASDGELTTAEVLAADCALTALGLTSLGHIRLIDAIEDEFGVDIELGGLDTLDGLVGRLSPLVDRPS
ncbi:phosphopantetheine binding protein [Nonomuraea polychroma]|uniref:Phosphopantetheine binding protein n=1 Tax=Nonomuraea polychroma TaxID=46176 RepID=A0A438LZS1_9ACTN|nr:phosphopantetheine-binding protein [Nonomuraea polychroma]RVX39030.1 phosphopantetheine binding protein [Nonomuraea polychroma]